MKKLLLTLGILMMATSLTYAVEEETPAEENVAVAENAAPTEGVTLSKGDSFMVAFGMEPSAVIGGEGGAISSPAAATAVAGTSAHVGSVGLTSSQNTPYSYK